MNKLDLAFAGLARQAGLIRNGEVSSRELVELYLERIERLDPELNSYRVVMAERALAEADQAHASRGDRERPLLGVPIAVKDNVDVAGEVTTHGTSAYGRHANADAEIVKRLRAVGGVILGKTLLPELAVYPWTESATFGVTRNPWDPTVTTGGSSGGSAAAVAAGLAAAGMATDGGGSIRIPAACCGLFGLKPQRGRVSLMPNREHWHGLTVFGSITRSVLDSALWLDLVAGRAEGDAETARPAARSFVDAAKTKPGKLRIAVSTATGQPPVKVQAEVEQAVEQTAELLRSLGHDVERRDPRYGFLLPRFMPRWLRGIYDDAARLPHPERLERRVRRLVAAGKLVTPSLVARSRAAEPQLTARMMREIFSDFDVLLTPTIPRLPWPLLRFEGRSVVGASLGAADIIAFTAPWNVTGQPAASVPPGFSNSGLPLAVQLIGRPHDEATLLSLSAQIEAEQPWAPRRPAVAT